MGIKHLRRRGLGCSNHTGLWFWGEICQLEVTDPYKSLQGLVMGPAQGGMVAKLPWNSLWHHWRCVITTLAARVISDSSAPAGCGKGFKK